MGSFQDVLLSTNVIFSIASVVISVYKHFRYRELLIVKETRRKVRAELSLSPPRMTLDRNRVYPDREFHNDSFVSVQRIPADERVTTMSPSRLDRL